MEIKDLYKLLGECIVKSTNIDWHEAQLKLIVVDKTVEYNLNFIDNNVTKQNAKLNKPVNLTELILNFNKDTIEKGFKKWNRANYLLWNDEKFDMEFIWDQKLEDELNSFENEA